MHANTYGKFLPDFKVGQTDHFWFQQNLTPWFAVLVIFLCLNHHVL